MKTTALLLLVLTLSATAFCSNILNVPEVYPTIQEAIDAAVPGDRIEIIPGTYAESLSISVGGITIVGTQGKGQSVVLVPATWDKPPIRVEFAETGDPVTLEGLTFTESWGIAALLTGESIVEFRDCVFFGNTIDIQASSTASVLISDCHFYEPYEAMILAVDNASVEMVACLLEIPPDMAAVEITAGSSFIATDCKFDGLTTSVSALYSSPNTYGVFALNGGSVELYGCAMDHFSQAVALNTPLSVVIEGCEIVDSIFGVHLFNGPTASTELIIRSTIFQSTSRAIALFGQAALVEISDNRILDTFEGPAIQICGEVCGCTKWTPFDGQITGSGNYIEEARKRTCPPFRAPFWPEDFLK